MLDNLWIKSPKAATCSNHKGYKKAAFVSGFLKQNEKMLPDATDSIP
jgi:hypothetical protein